LKFFSTRVAGLPLTFGRSENVGLRILIFVLCLLALWVPIALPLSLLIQDPVTIWGLKIQDAKSIITLLVLYAEFIWLVGWWNRTVYQQPQALKRFGLRQPRRSWRELVWGLLTGYIGVLVLFTLQGALGWLTWTAPPPGLPKVMLEGFLVALGISFAEELFYRGWLLDELQRGGKAQRAVWVSSLIYSGVHFLKPWPEFVASLPGFPGLLMLGLVLVWSKQATQGRLGLSIGLHAGLVWGYYILKVGQCVQIDPQVPDWLTGINGNPLASLSGLFVLGIIAIAIRRQTPANPL
jgi:uncharacterized protein